MAVCETDTERAMGNDPGEGEIRGFSVEVTFDDLEVRGHRAEVVVTLFISQISQAKDLRDFVRSEEFSELSCQQP